MLEGYAELRVKEINKEDISTSIIQISITEKGILAEAEDYFKEKYEEHKEQRDTNKILRRSNIWSPVFAGLAAFISACGLVNGIIEDNKQANKEAQSQQQMTQQDSVLKIQQTQINSLLIKVARQDSAAKD